MRPTRVIAGRPQAAQRLLTLFAALALFLQSLAVQTHIHPQPPVFAAGVTQAADAPAPAPLKNQDPLDSCRLCQELVHSGLFAMPAASVLFTALVFVMAAPLVMASAGSIAAPPAAWRSRAPPRH